MKTRSFRADRLDIPAFTDDEGDLSGELTLAQLGRLRDGLHPDLPMDTLDLPVTWQIQGQTRPRPGGSSERWLHLQAHADVPLTCQRCLGRVDVPATLDRWFQFVDSEALAAELDADAEDDVLVSSRSFDLLELLEDELLLSLPLVPTHDSCPNPPQLQFESEATDPLTPDETPRHPFAALAGLKKGPGDLG